MKSLLKAISMIALCLGVFWCSYRLTARYLDRFRRKYITIENEHINA